MRKPNETSRNVPPRLVGSLPRLQWNYAPQKIRRNFWRCPAAWEIEVAPLNRQAVPATLLAISLLKNNQHSCDLSLWSFGRQLPLDLGHAAFTGSAFLSFPCSEHGRNHKQALVVLS
jgi:hypothetical protein